MSLLAKRRRHMTVFEIAQKLVEFVIHDSRYLQLGLRGCIPMMFR